MNDSDQDFNEIMKLINKHYKNDNNKEKSANSNRYFKDKTSNINIVNNSENKNKNKNKNNNNDNDNIKFYIDTKTQVNGINYKMGNVNYWKKNFKWDEKLLKKMKEVFGFEKFRLNQKAIINAVLSDHDVFVCMPTGGGKSLIYQLPAMIEKGVSIVIMPLISLIEDQFTKLTNYGISCFVLKSTGASTKTISQNIIDIFENILNEEDNYAKILFLTPEKLNKSELTKNYLSKIYEKNLLKRIVVDEAHCVSNWGNDFRADYLNIKLIKNICPNIPVLALTATASDWVRISVINELKMSKNTLYFKSSFDRKNLFYEVRNKSKNHTEELVSLIRENFKNKSGIIYCTTKKESEFLYGYLKKKNLSVGIYNGSLDLKDKNDNQNKWMSDKIKIIIATIAFGMGIDKPDVRFVIHNNLSKSIENYYQESGRAGRDGNDAHCILYYAKNDIKTFDFFNSLKNKSNNRQINRNDTFKLNSMYRYCENVFKCKRKFWLNYFGEDYKAENCSNCDNCINEKKFIRIDVYDSIILIYNTIDLNKYEKITKIKFIDMILDKNKNKELHKKIKNLDKEKLTKIIDKMIYLNIYYELINSIQIKGRDIITRYMNSDYKYFKEFKQKYTSGLRTSSNKNDGKKYCNIKLLNIKKSKTIKSKVKTFNTPIVYKSDKKRDSYENLNILTNEEYEELLERLKNKRIELCDSIYMNKEDEGIKNYEGFFPLDGLIKIARYLLIDKSEMINHSKVGRVLIFKYGKYFIEVITEFLKEYNIKRDFKKILKLIDKDKTEENDEDFEYSFDNKSQKEEFKPSPENIKKTIDNFLKGKEKIDLENLGKYKENNNDCEIEDVIIQDIDKNPIFKKNIDNKYDIKKKSDVPKKTTFNLEEFDDDFF